MNYIEKKDNIEKEYDVSFSKTSMWGVLHRLVRQGSYRVKGDFDLPDSVKNEVTKDNIHTKVILANNDPMYEDVEKIYKYTSNSMCSYHDDTTAVTGTKVVAPKLARIIRGMIEDMPTSLYDFLLYDSDEELVPIDEKIARANAKVDSIDNSNYEEKINALKELGDLCKAKENGEYFDPELIKSCYKEAYNLLELSLVRETRTGLHSKMLMKNLRPLKK